MSLTNMERETIILYNEAEKTAIIDTCSPAMIRCMDKYCAERTDCSRVKKDQYGAKYVCPKRWVKIRPTRQLSDAERRELALRADHNFGRAHKEKDPVLEYIKAGYGLPPIGTGGAGLYRGEDDV